MKNLFVLLVVAFATLSANANEICTVSKCASPQGMCVGKIVSVVQVDLSKDQAALVVKKDGSVLENVAYADAVYANPSKKLGNVEGASLINLSRDQGATQGVNILMATLSNAQEMAHFDLTSSSGSNDGSINNLSNGISVLCTTEK